jgi:3-oxoacyl-[acyl-carrier-protein] synthase II
MNQPDPTWITGVGVACSLGSDFETVSRNLIAGRSGIDTIRSFDVSQHPSQIGAAVHSVPCPQGWDTHAFAARPKLQQLPLWCCASALRDAGYDAGRGPARVGLILGTATEWMLAWEVDGLPRDDTRYCEPANDLEALTPMVQRELGLRGPVVTLSAACATGNFALALARHWLELGWADVCLAGACDAAVTPLTLAGFGNLRALSRQNDRPQAASRPFDQDRDGFVLGEGGAVFVLERASRAKGRGARTYGELAGCGLSSDAYHLVIPSPEPTYAIAAMRAALADAEIGPHQVDYVNAHGTSTPIGDAAEAKALRTVFGEWTNSIPVSSTKSMTGHLLTAASALEALACLATFRYNAMPPTINLDHPDPECVLCHVAHTAREGKTRVAISNSFGFGGSNSCAVFRAV